MCTLVVLFSAVALVVKLQVEWFWWIINLSHAAAPMVVAINFLKAMCMPIYFWETLRVRDHTSTPTPDATTSFFIYLYGTAFQRKKALLLWWGGMVYICRKAFFFFVKSASALLERWGHWPHSMSRRQIRIIIEVAPQMTATETEKYYLNNTYFSWVMCYLFHRRKMTYL